MKLSSITIKNFRSIENLTFKVEEVDGSYTFALIGVNESGKSSFLEAIALVGNKEAKISQKDYMDKNKKVLITLNYKLSKKWAKNWYEEITARNMVNCSQDDITELVVGVSFEAIDADREESVPEVVAKLLPLQERVKNIPLDMDMQEFLLKRFRIGDFRVILWKPNKEHLIAEEIDLKEFADNIRMSLPLLNCFRLAGLEPTEAFVSDPREENYMAGQLENTITKHINEIWPSHPVKIKFQISGGKLTFLVEDDQVKSRSKTIDQRSDGFRHFISFLLTTSIDSVRKLFPQSLFLIDEPETHLHPQAQADLLKELIRITKGENGETVLFFATHSNHMVDKKNVDRCYKFSKHNGVTEIERADSGPLNSHAEVNYNVFEVAGNDYHDELYGYLASTDEGKQKLDGLKKKKKWKMHANSTPRDISLPTYIRHSIHHPENKENDPFTDEELRESIETMRGLVQEVVAEEMAKAGENGS